MDTKITDVSLNLLRELNTDEDENTLISPLSIISALGMTTNGAGGQTLEELEEFLGMNIGSLNEFMYSYTRYLPSDEKYKVNLANSIWFKDEPTLEVKKEFLQTNKNYYDIDIYKSNFDESTKDDINNWVSKETDGQIEDILEEAPSEDTVMYLVNALSFDAEWDRIYKENEIREGEFISEDGDREEVDFMNSNEYGYIELDNAKGVIKPYADNKYSFVAVLPEEGHTVSELVKNLDGKTLNQAIKNKSDEKVITSIPKFEFEYDVKLNDSLKNLGVKDAFSGEKADFTNMAVSQEGNIFIDKVIHKTKIEVDEKGTKAGAATVVEMVKESALEESPDVKEVILNRPFMFMIIDNEFNIPIFAGIVNEIDD